MKSLSIVSTLGFAFALANAASAIAAPKTYQVTGPVLEITPTSFIVQKGKEKWEIEKTATTTMTAGEPKVGDKVTIEYTMTAQTVTAKPTKK